MSMAILRIIPNPCTVAIIVKTVNRPLSELNFKERERWFAEHWIGAYFRYVSIGSLENGGLQQVLVENATQPKQERCGASVPFFLYSVTFLKHPEKIFSRSLEYD
jgi:hypothetical protein